MNKSKIFILLGLQTRPLVKGSWSDMDVYTKGLWLASNLDKLAEMDISTGEYNKMDQWINGLIKLPFGRVTSLPVCNTDSFDKKRDYIQSTMDNMNKAIYGHTEAKTHILQVIGKWIRNPRFVR